MSFRFKLYRILTALALMITGFFTFGGILFAFVNFPALVSAVIWGACFIHSILSVYLQRSIMFPEITLKESSPGGIRIMGGITLIFAALLFFCGLVLQMIPTEVLKEVMAEAMKQNNGNLSIGFLRGMGVALLLISLILTFNANLSFYFLRQWTKMKEGREE
ncbi:hypothetical protein [Chitinophaga solisilvae]|uniref:hypothetical protein n=1 Tax=Chitinophaga solisilvae TaxID=1233460 RepID=UPI00136F44DC|nr:hypothetical protein [Chitinophaga solisilvae]